MHQDIERSKIFRRIKVGLDYNDFITIKDKFHKNIINISKNPNTPASDVNRREHRLKSTLSNGELVGQFNALFNLIKDFPLPKNFSLILNFNYDISNVRLLIDYNLEYKDSLNKEISNLIEEIFKKISLDQDLTNVLINLILPFKKVILIPSFRTLETSEKTYQDREIREISTSLAIILDKSFNCIPINAQKSEPFKIPNLALMLSIIKQEQISDEYRELINMGFLEYFFKSLRKIFPDLDLSINFQLTELTTKGGYKEYGRYMGDWTKLGHGTQELISLLFLLLLPEDCVYIIDEPESGLHSGLQLKVLNFIKEVILNDKKYSKQFFLATHSTSFIDFTGDCSYYVCKKSKESFVIEILEKENINILRSELGLTPGALLQSNGIIWVEGPSDVFYVKMLFQCFGFDLDVNNILIKPYFGRDNILGGRDHPPHITPSFLRSINPNFLVVMDSDKKGLKMQIPQKRIERKKQFEAEGYKFWLIDKYCDIEGILPQKVLDDFFSITPEEGKKIFKSPYEKLEEYIISLKEAEQINMNDLSYDKTRDAPKISQLILLNSKYLEEIQNNSYLQKVIIELSRYMLNWSEQLIFKEGAILQKLYPQDASQDLMEQNSKIVKDYFSEFTDFEVELNTLLKERADEQEKYSDDFDGILFYLIDLGSINKKEYQMFLEIKEKQHNIFLKGIIPSFDQLREDTLFLKNLKTRIIEEFWDSIRGSEI